MKRRREETSLSPTPRIRHDGDINIPLYVTVEILKKLPTQSIVRFQFVSKLWSLIINSRRDFIDFIMSRSLSQPSRDAYFVDSKEYFSPISSGDKDFIYIPKPFWQYLRGLVCCWSKSGQVVLYNPTTRQSLYLPKKKTKHMFTSFIGYDPLENQYKVLFLSKTQEHSCQVFTLGETTEKWKSIQGVGSHQPLQGAVCINGTIYYQAGTTEYDSTSLYKLMSFDVRSEKFYHVVDAPKTLMDYRSFLINYQGKLGFVCCEKGVEIWVMEPQGWSKIFFKEMEGSQDLCSMGVTRRGEILFVKWKYHTRSEKLPIVLYYNPNVNGKRCVFLEDIYLKARRHTRFFNVWAVPDYVENTMRLY